MRIVPGRRVLHHAGRWSLITPAVGLILGVGSHDCLLNRPDGFGSPDGRLGRGPAGTPESGSGGAPQEGLYSPR